MLMIFYMKKKVTSNLMPKCELIYEEKLGSLSHYARFRISNLEVGQAKTMGIAIRRTLLGNIASLRIKSVFIDGAFHEYSTIPGVRECIHDILANLKEIVFRGESSNNIKAYVDFKGPGIVTSKNLCFLPNQNFVEVLDINQYIAKIETETELRLELIINSFQENIFKNNTIESKELSNKQGKKTFLQQPNFCIDGYSSPIRNENHYIEKSLTSSNKENLMIEIWTNGALTPIESLQKALQTLSFIFSLDIETNDISI